MSKNPQQTAYMYASSRVRALENGIVGKDRIEQLVNAAGMDEVYARLSEFGVELVKDADGCVLEGRIDRVDQWTGSIDGGSPSDFLRVIDYKRGGKALKLADKFRSLPVQNEIIEDLIIAAEGEYLMCMSAARYNGGKKETPAGFTQEWCKRYAASWRRDNKESELYRILDVFLNMK